MERGLHPSIKESKKLPGPDDLQIGPGEELARLTAQVEECYLFARESLAHDKRMRSTA